jgi:hypothetical protein
MIERRLADRGQPSQPGTLAPRLFLGADARSKS